MNKDTVGFDSETLPPGQLEELRASDEQTGVSQPRRRFSRLGLGAAPIVISLVSKPVLGAQCLSNMLSGNLSDPNRGNCSLGWSPGGWGQPGGTINGVSDAQAWALTGYSYGVYKTSCGRRRQARCYEGGTTVAGLPVGLLTQSPAEKTLREVLLSEADLNRDRHVLAAWLNARLSANSSGTFDYILTTDQVIDLANGSPLPPPYLDLNTFLDSTWRKQP